jgi:steroid 5-alpha reductase family enzyme
MLEAWFQGWAVISAVFLLLWLVEVRQNDASLVDAGWAASLGALALWFAARGDGLWERRVALVLIVGAWSVRLAAHIVLRHRRGREDARYREIRTARGSGAHTFFFFFYQAQGLLAALLSVPFLLIAENGRPGVHGLEVAALALAAASIALESVADRQLERHRAKGSAQGKTFRGGLWKFSRHPNYFFEWLVWVAFGAAALGAPYGWVGLTSPILMLFLILKVTGIPPAESRALRSRGDDYRRYQETTSAFVPWFPRKEKAS